MGNRESGRTVPVADAPKVGRRGWVAIAVLAALAVSLGLGRRLDAQAQPAMSQIKPVKGIPGIFAMDPDGSNPRPLVKVPGLRWHGSPTWSRDGKMVAFDGTADSFSAAHLFVYVVYGPFKGLLKDMGLGLCPAFSPDDSTIAFQRDPGGPDGAQPGVWLMNSDGSRRRWLCDGDHPKWSHDGKKLLVTHEQRQPVPIDVVTVETGQVSRLLQTRYAQLPGAVYSPDGGKIAFIGYADQQRTTADLVVMAADGSPASQQVVMRGRIGWTPNWSPDGKQLTFVLWTKNQGVDIDTNYVIDADGKSLPVKLKNQDVGTRNVEVEWSPDGKTLVFGSDREIDGRVRVERSDDLKVEISKE